MIRAAVLSAKVRKRLRKVPRHIVVKLLAWVSAVEADGLDRTVKFVSVEEVHKHEY